MQLLVALTTARSNNGHGKFFTETAAKSVLINSMAKSAISGVLRHVQNQKLAHVTYIEKYLILNIVIAHYCFVIII